MGGEKKSYHAVERITFTRW